MNELDREDMKILVVDDEEEIGLIVSMILRKRGHICETANRLKLGEEKLIAHRYDMLFLDVNLPDGVGLDFISIAHKLQPNLKICVISAYDSGGEPERALHLGASNFLKKPFSKQEIIETVAQIQD